MTPLVLMLLATPPPPSQAYVQIKNQGTSQGYARIINCSGSGVTCAVNTATAEATLTVNLSDAGSIAVPACAAGYVLDGDGGVLYCINVIATATALAANPTDCSANQYANAIAASGNLTCSQVTYSQLGGSPIAGGSNPQVQYNNAGILGGMGNTESTSAGDLNRIAQNSHPAGPSYERATHYDFAPDAGWFHIPRLNDPTMAQAYPPQLLDSSHLMPVVGNRDEWLAQCFYLDSWPMNCTWTNSATSWNVNGTGTSSGAGIDAGWWSHQHWCIRLGATTGNTSLEDHDTQLSSFYSGGSGVGGFVWWARASILATMPSNTGRVFYGVQGSVSAFSATQEMTSLTNMIGFTCDPGDVNFKLCSNDATGTATCGSSLGSTFPCKTAGATYDFWLFSPPSSANVYWYIVRQPSTDNVAQGATASGLIASDFPDTSQGLAGHMHENNGDAGVAGRNSHGGECEWIHF